MVLVDIMPVVTLSVVTEGSKVVVTGPTEEIASLDVVVESLEIVLLVDVVDRVGPVQGPLSVDRDDVDDVVIHISSIIDIINIDD